MSADPQDPRWGGQVPWFLRHANFVFAGSFETFFARVQQRLVRLCLYNEFRIPNLQWFGTRLETESSQRFRFKPTEVLNAAIERYFDSNEMVREARTRMWNDPEEKAAIAFREKLNSALRRAAAGIAIPLPVTLKLKALKDAKEPHDLLAQVEASAAATREARTTVHVRALTRERIATLEVFLQILPKKEKEDQEALQLLLRDLHRAMAESSVNLKIDEREMLIVPLEEQLLQQEVVDKLLPRLAERFPNHAAELVKAYHDLLQGVDGNKVFGNAFKALEATARELTKDGGLLLSEKKHLAKYFPKLHPTIHGTILKLAGHRGDEGGHGGKGPDSHEMRYLLFTICNVALLFLEYPDYAS